MFAEPPNFDRERLTQTLGDHWGLSASSLSYKPVGFGTHHFVATDESGAVWWVNVDELAAKTWIGVETEQALHGLERALRTAAALRHAGLEFVLAPIERPKGGIVVPLDDTYAVSVFPYVAGRSNDFGEFASDEERRLVLKALGRMHATTDKILPELPRRDSLAIPMCEPFFASLNELRSPWTGGPFSEPAREVLTGNADAIRASFTRYDDLVRSVRGRDGAWVVTHGEPHGGNIIRTTDDALLLVDWDTVAVGPRERDLWMVEPRNDDDWRAYTSSGGSPDVNTEAIELYRLWWTLSEIAGCTMTLRSPHSDDANTQTTWRGLRSYIAEAS